MGWPIVLLRRKNYLGVQVSNLLQRYAEIEDELASRGIDPLIAEKEEIKKIIKDSMLKNGVNKTFDEVSNYEAVMQSRSSDAWDLENLKKILTGSQLERYTMMYPNIAAIEEGIKNGDLSRSKLEEEGAVFKTPGTPALYIRKRKE